MAGTILLRADATTRTGTGHVMRCIALAQAWQSAGGTAVFATSACPPALADLLRSGGIKVFNVPRAPGSTEDAAETARLARENQASWVVVDGYEFGAEYQRNVKVARTRLLCIDDYGHAAHYFADLVLNQNIYAHADIYEGKEPTTRLLLGVRYALLRQEFLRWQGWRREFPEVARRVLVTMGGSDPHNVTLVVLQSLQLISVRGLQIKAVVGGSNPHYEALASFAGQSRLGVSLERAVTNIAEEMARADVAISAGGSTSWELAFMGLPSCVIVLAENQSLVGKFLHDQGIAVNAGWFSSVERTRLAGIIEGLILDRGARYEMSCRGRLAVDGNGAQRVVEAIMECQSEVAK